jgi:uncharacterized membrane protein YhaH (DUF805 family)
MIYKFIDNNGSEISVNSLSSLQSLVESETVKESTKVKAGLRGKWTTASNIEELIFIKEVLEEPKKEVIPEIKPKEVEHEDKPEEVIPEVKPKEVEPEDKPEEVIPEVEHEDKPEEVIPEVEPEEVIPEVEPEEEKLEYELEEEKRDKTYDDENIEGLNFFDAIKTCLRKYFVIKGRASRSEYWFLQLLFTPLAMYVGFWSDPVSAGTIDPPPLYILSTIIVILLFIPSITSQIRRFHDKDKSGWFIFINIIPLVGWLIALVMLLDKGTPGKNRFGEYPLKSKK